MVKTKDVEIKKNLLNIWENLNKFNALKEIKNFSDDLINGIYAQAYQLYHDGKLDEAEDLFTFLCFYNRHEPNYFLALGAVFQLKKLYQPAIDIYAIAHLLDKKNYKPIFHMGQCHLSDKNRDEAKKCFQLICQHASDENLCKKAAVYLNVLKK